MTRGELVGNDRIYQAVMREIERVDNAFVTAEVDAVEGNRASLKAADSPATTAWVIPPGLLVEVGDLVFAYRRGSFRKIEGVLNRNALDAMARNPFTAPGQVLIAGPDGQPTVLEPPGDPELDYTLEWDGELQAIVWVEKV